MQYTLLLTLGVNVPSLVPSPKRMRAVLPALIEAAAREGLKLEGLGGACGPHPCLFGADPRAFELRAIPGPVDFRSYGAACDTCSVRYACLGVRTAHLQLHGDECFQPIAASPPRT